MSWLLLAACTGTMSSAPPITAAPSLPNPRSAAAMAFHSALFERRARLAEPGTASRIFSEYASQSAQRQMLEHPQHRARLHDPVADRHQPCVRVHRHSFRDAVLRLEPQLARDGFEEPQRRVAEGRGERAALTGFPDDLVHAVAFADGVGHLADEQGKSAGLVLAHGVGRGAVAVEIFKCRPVPLGFGHPGFGQTAAGDEHLEAVTGERALGPCRRRRPAGRRAVPSRSNVRAAVSR